MLDFSTIILQVVCLAQHNCRDVSIVSITPLVRSVEVDCVYTTASAFVLTPNKFTSTVHALIELSVVRPTHWTTSINLSARNATLKGISLSTHPSSANVNKLITNRLRTSIWQASIGVTTFVEMGMWGWENPVTITIQFRVMGAVTCALWKKTLPVQMLLEVPHFVSTISARSCCSITRKECCTKTGLCWTSPLNRTWLTWVKSATGLTSWQQRCLCLKLSMSSFVTTFGSR